jgi:ABC-type transport system involved in cytochrome bd biosynthesis fused ATPase/permease subunit
LRDAPILILDEPTSSVDVHTEAGIMQAMERLMQGRTTFMIAHRLTTLANCEVLLEVRGGRVSPVTRTGARHFGEENSSATDALTGLDYGDSSGPLLSPRFAKE